MERHGDVTFQGNPLTVIGPRLETGDMAPDFQLLANDLSPVTLADSAGMVRLILSVPSLDTPVCDMETRKFNEHLDTLGGRVAGYAVSADLPFAQARWCGAANVEAMRTLSDHRDMAFGNAYGVHIKELRLDARAVFVLDAEGVLRHIEYVPEITDQPDYAAALAAIEALLL